MKKLFNLSQRVCDNLAVIAKEQGQTQTSLVETALNIYFMIHFGDKQSANKLSIMMQEAEAKGQLSMIDELFLNKRD